MALIRQADAVRLSEQAISLDLGDLAAHAEAIIARARAQAEQILDDAKKERARLIAGGEHIGVQQGQAKGLEQGLKQGLEKGSKQALEEQRARLTALEAEWAKQLQNFASAREELLLQASEQVVALALLVAQRVVRQHIAARPEAVVEQALAMVRMASSASRLVLRVSPADAQLLRAAMPKIVEASGLAGEQHMRIVEDAALSRGSLVLDVAGGGRIEATIEGQLQRVAKLLLGEAAMLVEPPREEAGHAASQENAPAQQPPGSAP